MTAWHFKSNNTWNENIISLDQVHTLGDSILTNKVHIYNKRNLVNHLSHGHKGNLIL